MNRIYRLVRDPVNGRCKVVSELARQRGTVSVTTPAVRAGLPTRIALGAALLAALPASALDYTAPITVNAGESLDLASGDSVLHTGSSYAVTVTGRDATLHATDLDLRVTGNGSGIGALAGGSVQIEGGHIQLGDGSASVGYALNASGAGSVIRANNLVIDAYRNGSGYGTVNATSGGKVWLTGGRVSSGGHALYATGSGSELHVTGTEINNGGNSAVYAEGGALLAMESLQLGFAPGNNGYSGRLSSSGTGSVLSLTDVDVVNGYFDISEGGLLRINGGSATTNGGSVRLVGNRTKGIYASAEITGGTFETTGGYGVNVNDWGRLTANGAHFTVRDGQSGLWLSSAASLADLTDTVISTYGTNGYGHGVDVWGGTATMTGGSIDTHGDGVYGLRASGSNPPTAYSRIRAKGLDITTYGNGGGGVFLGGSTADAQLEGGHITVLGNAAFGIVQMNTAQLTADTLSIHAKGAGSGAYRSYITVFGPHWDRLTFNNSQLQTEDGPALWLQGSNHALTLVNTDVVARQAGSVDDGRLLRVSDTVFTDGSSVATSDILFNADNSRLTGDVVVDSATANMEMTLANASVLTGALRGDSGFHVASLSLDDSSRWNLRGDSTVGTLQHGGTIAFVAPTQGDFKTLTITGDYVGNGGTWVMNRQLGDDGSAGDALVIQGNSSGTATVRVDNAGGAGALTSEGIRLISVAGQSDAQFALQGRAVAGAYDYFLYKGGVRTPDDGNWYLRSEYVAPVDPPVDPVDPLDPVDPGPKVERPEPAIYLANQSAALRMFQHSLHDRAGDPGTRVDAAGSRGALAWARVRSGHLDRHAGGEQIRVDSRVDNLMVGVGHDLAANAGGQLQLGLMGGHGRASSDAVSTVTGYTARGVVTGSSVGAYGTWLQDADMQRGAYVDSWVQYSRFRNRVQGEGLAEERYRSRNWSGSVEAGYVLPLQRNVDRGLYLEPQLQVVHNHYDADQVIEANGTRVESRRAGGTSTRLGARLYTRALTQRQGNVHPFVAINWWSGGTASAIAVDGVSIRRDLPDDIYEAKAGVQVNLAGGWRGWGELGHQTGSQGYRDTSAQLGVSYRW